MSKTISIFWFRRDLRLDDNVGLYYALQSGKDILPIFIFDSEILQELPKNDARVTFIHETLQKINSLLISNFNSGIAMYYGSPKSVFEQLTRQYVINSVYTNHDYEPYAIKRDNEINAFLNSKNISLKTFKDQVIFERDEIVKSDGSPYKVYTPYSKKWLEQFKSNNTLVYNSEDYLDNLYKLKNLPTLRHFKSE